MAKKDGAGSKTGGSKAGGSKNVGTRAAPPSSEAKTPRATSNDARAKGTKKPAKGSPFAALAETVKQKKLEATRALVAAKVKASTKVAEAAKEKAANVAQATKASGVAAAKATASAKPADAKGAGKPTAHEARTAAASGSVGPSATPELTRAFSTESAGSAADLLTLDPAKSGPLASYPYDDRVAFHDAFGDVRPLGAPAPGGKAKKPKASGVRGPRAVAERAHRDAAEEAARARLERLVVGGVSFQIRRDEHGMEAKRKGAAERTLLLILRGELTPEARVDLHGLGRDEAVRVVGRFIKDARSKSRLTVLIIHGKGAHSEGGIGVLEEACVEALTKGGAAPYVEAFATAPTRFGGRGAIVARLRDR
jgi:DNA-nicking Smr family endonuclease